MIKYNENNKVKLYFLIYITICSISIATWIIIILFIKFYIIKLFYFLKKILCASALFLMGKYIAHTMITFDHYTYREIQ